MFKHTESNIVFDQLYGTNKTISPQDAKTFNLSKQQQQPQSLALKDYMLQSQYLSQEMTKYSPVSHRILEEDQNVDENDNTSNILGALQKQQQSLNISRSRSNQKQTSIKIIEDLKAQNRTMQEQIHRLNQMVNIYEIKIQQTNKKYHDQFKSKRETECLSQNSQMFQMTQQLKYYEQRTSTLEQQNKQLSQKISLMRSKYQIQYKQMYQCQIKRLQTEIQLVRCQNEVQTNDLKKKLKQQQLKFQKLKKSVKGSAKHSCNTCRQYQLLQSLNRLYIQLAKIKEQKQILQRRIHIKNIEFK